eukprot:m51a1_g2140 hypothetical protein (354) ;mRNA; r:1734772-1737572
MAESRVGAEAIRAACTAATVRLEGGEHGPDLGPCAKCCGQRPRKLITIGGPALEIPRETGDGRVRVFVFDRCKSNCNTSRLHMGGRVVVVVTVRGPQGPIAEAVSEPLALVSRSSYVRRPRDLPATPRVTWDTGAGAAGARDASAAPEAPVNEGRENEELMEQLALLVRLQSEQLERISVECETQWMAEHRLGAEAIKAACLAASIRLEGREQGPNLEPCAKCCGLRLQRLIAIDGSALEIPRETDDGRARVFVFDRCKSNCNTSRLHMGGRVVVVVTVRGPQGPIAEAVSEPLALVSSPKSDARDLESRAPGSGVDQGSSELMRQLALLVRLQGEQMERVRYLERLVHSDKR